MSYMELSGVQLKALVELSRCGTMTATASALGYTPGAISQQIAALERAAGVELIRQVGRRVELTDAGHTLVTHAGLILEAQAEAAAAIERTRAQLSARLVLGVFGTAAAAFLPPALRRLREFHPGVHVVSREVDVDQAHAEVSSGRVDLALGLDYPDAPIARDAAVELVRLRSERFGLAMSLTRETPAGPLRLIDAADWDWILPAPATDYGRAFRSACRRAGFEPRVVHEVTDTATSMAMTGAGLGVAPVTDLMLRLRSEGIISVPLRDLVERHVVVAVRSSARHRPSIEALIDALRMSSVP
jgi:DNA-binding transcriptional LysR family regulator